MASREQHELGLTTGLFVKWGYYANLALLTPRLFVDS